MKKIKCYSVRLQSLVSISEKAYKATAFDGTSAIIPKSQVFGDDLSVQKSEAYWISAWILEQKELQYSTKKSSWFDKELSHASNEGIEIVRHIPEEKTPVDVEPINELVKPISVHVRIENKEILVSSLGEVLEFLKSTKLTILQNTIDNITHIWGCIEKGLDRNGKLKDYKSWEYNIGNNSNNPTIYFDDVTNVTCRAEMIQTANKVVEESRKKYGKFKDFKIDLVGNNNFEYHIKMGLNWYWDNISKHHFPIFEYNIISDLSFEEAMKKVDNFIKEYKATQKELKKNALTPAN